MNARWSNHKFKVFLDRKHKCFLFGSRVDDLKKGGDIDLFIKISDQSDLFNKKIRFLARVKKCLGEQKIDVVFNQNDQRLIEKEIQKWAIPL